MRHNKNFNHLGRQAGHRKAMLSNMASSLILHKRIETTVAKAKAVKQFVEPLVTKIERGHDPFASYRILVSEAEGGRDGVVPRSLRKSPIVRAVTPAS